MTLTYLFQRRWPTLTLDSLPTAGLWTTSKHPAPGTLAAVKPTAQLGWGIQGLDPEGRRLGHMLLGPAITSESDKPRPLCQPCCQARSLSA